MNAAGSNWNQNGGNGQNQIQCYNCQGLGAYVTWVFQHLQNARHLNSKGEQHQNLPPAPKQNVRTCASASASASARPQPMGIVTSPQYHSPEATIELNGRVNETDIFVGDIQVTALIDIWSTSFHHYLELCDETWVWHISCKANATFRENGGFSIQYLGYIEATLRIPSINRLWWVCSNAHP